MRAMEGFQKIKQIVREKKSLLKKGTVLTTAILLNSTQLNDSKMLHQSNKEKTKIINTESKNPTSNKEAKYFYNDPKTNKDVKTETLRTFNPPTEHADSAISNTVVEQKKDTVNITSSTPPVTENIKTKEEIVKMDISSFNEIIKQMISDALKRDTSSTELKDLTIKREGDHLVFEATLTKLFFEINVTGNIVQDKNDIIINNEKVGANIVIRKKAKNAIVPMLKDIMPKFKRIQEKDKGMKIDSIRIEPNAVDIFYKSN